MLISAEFSNMLSKSFVEVEFMYLSVSNANNLNRLKARIDMVKSKSTFITIEDETLFKWKKLICSDIDFSTSHLLAYFRTISSVFKPKSLVIIIAGFIFPLPVMYISRMSPSYPFSVVIWSLTLMVLFLFAEQSTLTLFHLFFGRLLIVFTIPCPLLLIVRKQTLSLFNLSRF